MPTWKVHLRQSIGACSIAVGIVGLLLDFLTIFAQSGIGISEPRISFQYVFFLVCGVAMIWFACCFLSGIYLWHGQVRGYWMALSLALFQIAYAILFIPITLSFSGQRGTQVAAQAILVFRKVDNGLSLLYSLALLFLLGAFFRKSDFRGGKIPAETTIGNETSKEFRSRPRSIYIVRGLGVLNTFFGFLGVALALVDVVSTYLHRDALTRNGFSFETSLIGAAIDFVLLIGLSIGGYLLTRLDRRGVVISNIILSAEVIYWLVSTLTPSLSSFTNFGLSPQILTVYPLLALPILNWAARHLDKRQEWRHVHVA